MRKMKKLGLKALSLVCALVVLVCTLPAPVGAETAAERYKRLKEELAAIGTQIESLENNKAAAEEYRAALAEQKYLIEQAIQAKAAEIEDQRDVLAKKEEEIASKRQVIYENDQLLQQRLVAIYDMSNVSVLSQVLAIEDFSRMLVTADALQRISKHDTELLDMLSEQRAQLEAEQAEIEALLAELVANYDQLALDEQALVDSIVATDANISYAEAQIAAQEQAYEDTNAALIQAQKEMIAIASKIGGSRYGDGSTYVGGVFTWPVPGYYAISCQFGSPDPNGSPHRGMDIASGGGPSIYGAEIVACGDGTVIEATYAHYSYGNYAVVDHGDGVKTLYAHCSQLLASAGTKVKKGDTIALVGSTGFSTGPHLHLEVHAMGGLQNPRAYLQG